MPPFLFPGFSKRTANRRLLMRAHDKGDFRNITAPDRMNGLNTVQLSYQTNTSEILMSVTIASILNLVGPDMMGGPSHCPAFIRREEAA